MGFHATVKLLSASIVVAVSGVFRIYIAFLLLGVKPEILICIAGGLVVYTVYTLDRTLESREDAVNRSEFTDARRDVALVVSLFVFAVGAYLLFAENLYAIAFLPLVTGYLYGKGVKVGGVRLKLKGGFGVKNLVVAFTWGAFITGIVAGVKPAGFHYCFVFLFFTCKLFINSVIYDFKDARGDFAGRY
jgi:4-hydroxybenzoate polyprenyltransferase